MAKTWLRPDFRYVPKEDKEKKEAERRRKSAEALNNQTHKKKKGRFDFIKDAAGATFNTIDDIQDAVVDKTKDAGGGILHGLDVYGNQVQSVPAFLFTKGTVEDGEYTTKRNLIGNPLSNARSHVKAQRRLGLVDEEDASGNPLQRVLEGFQVANRAGGAFQRDPDISEGLKFATGVGFDPTTYSPAVIGKIPKVGNALSKSRSLRTVDSLIEGFNSPRTAAKFIVGGALGTEAASRVNVPGVPEGLEQFAGGAVGGGIASNIYAPRVKTPKVTETVPPTERLHHGTPNIIPEGEILISPKGDYGPGFYVSRVPSIAGQYVETGDPMNLSEIPIATRNQNKVGPQIYRFSPTRDLKLLISEETLLPSEIESIRNVLKDVKTNTFPNEGDVLNSFDHIVRIDPTGLSGSYVRSVLDIMLDSQLKSIEVLEKAGWDGFASSPMAGHSQMTIFKPNEVLRPNLTAPESGTSYPSVVKSVDFLPEHQKNAFKGLREQIPDVVPDEEIIKLIKKWFPNTEDEPYFNPDLAGFFPEFEALRHFNPTSPGNERATQSKAARAAQKVLSAILGNAPENPNVANVIERGRYIDPEVQKVRDELQSLRDERPGDTNSNSFVTKPTKRLEEIHQAVQELRSRFWSLSPEEKSQLDTLEAEKSAIFSGKAPVTDRISELKAKLESMGEPDIGFPSRAELEAEYQKLTNINGRALTPEEHTRGQELREQLKNYDQLKRIHDGAAAARGDVDLGKGLADEPPVGTNVSSISPEQAKSYQDNPFTEAGDRALIEDYRYLLKQVTNTEALDRPQELTSSTYLNRRKQLSQLEEEIKRRGLDPSVKPEAPTRPLVVANRRRPDGTYIVLDPNIEEELPQRFITREEAQAFVDSMNAIDAPAAASVPIFGAAKEIPGPTALRELEDVPTETLRQRLSAIDTAPISDFEKKLLKSAMEKELSFRSETSSLPEDLEISGGANPERIVDIKPVSPGLTMGERAQNLLTEAKKLLLGYGIKNNEVATPIVKEATRIESIIRTQGARITRQIAHAERLLGANKDGIVENLNGKPVNKSVVQLADESFDGPIIDRVTNPPTREQKYTAEQRKALEAIRRSREQIEDLRGQFGIELNDEFVGKLNTSNTAQEYFNRLASRAGQGFVHSEINKMQSSKVSLAGAVTEAPPIPKEVEDVLNQHLRKVRGLNESESSKIYNAVNNSLRGLWATMDFSRLFIQDLPMYADLMLSNPKLASKIAKAQFSTLWDKHVVAKTMEEFDRRNYGTGRPTTTDWIKHNLHISSVSTDDFEGGIVTHLEKTPAIGKVLGTTNRVFADGGDLNRLFQADLLYQQWEKGNPLSFLGKHKNASREEILTAIANATNRSSGWTKNAFGGDIGRATMFAPRFFQSQLESILKATTDFKTLEGDIARRQLVKMFGVGVATTILLNEARGEDTVFDPTDPNFLRIRNLKGNDISLFGPWDSLVRGFVRSAPQIDSEGNISFGDPTYLVRSKLSPILSTAVDLLVGTNVVGEPSREISSVAKNLALPFGVRDAIDFEGAKPVLDKNPTSIGLGIFGLKATPLTEREQFENRLEEAGIKTSEPDYLIKRREFQAENPDLVPKAERGKFKRSQEIQADIRARREENEARTTSDDQPLSEFRENRKLLLTEQRNRLDEVLGESNRKPSTKQERWLDSYFKLFNKARDSVTNNIDPDKFDPLVAEWTNQNGTEALDFITRYLGVGLGPVEEAYYNDMRTLDQAGYFDMKKYTKMKSGLSDQKIDDYKAKVSAYRLEDPKRQTKDFIVSVREVFPNLSKIEQEDIANSNKEAYQNPELEKFKALHRKELLWFNNRAFWSTYNNAIPGKVEETTTSGSGGGSFPKPPSVPTPSFPSSPSGSATPRGSRSGAGLR